MCRNISIPDISQRFISKSQISHCSSAILIRQPILWVGGCQPVKIEATPPIIRTHGDISWDVNCTIRIPPSMCAPYAADYDGDEMTIFPVKHPLSTLKYETFKWDYDLDRMKQHYSEWYLISNL